MKRWLYTAFGAMLCAGIAHESMGSQHDSQTAQCEQQLNSPGPQVTGADVIAINFDTPAAMQQIAQVQRTAEANFWSAVRQQDRESAARAVIRDEMLEREVREHYAMNLRAYSGMKIGASAEKMRGRRPVRMLA